MGIMKERQLQEQQENWASLSHSDLVEALVEAQNEIAALREVNAKQRQKSNARKRALRALNQSMLAKNAQIQNGFNGSIEFFLEDALGFADADSE